MLPHRSILAGLLLALPNAAAFSQDNPWRVPSAPNGYVPGYAVQDYQGAPNYYVPAPQQQGWSQQPVQEPAPAYSWPQQQGWGQEQYGYGQNQSPPLPETGYSAYQPAPRPQQRAEANRYTYDVPPAPAAAPAPHQKWNGSTGYRQPSMTSTGSLFGGYSNTPPSRQRRQIKQYPPYGGYGEYPPLDGDPTTLDRSEQSPERRDPNQESAAGTAPPAGPPALYGPSTLTVPYAGLPGLGGYGYGGAYGYPARPYGWGW